ncbi:hypothetical protein [Flavilitoribacter nigricans]|uniref:DUF3179 domain-containing protein n=1 Tax=Flavilitoribacter nigricans (strain ATCC 23147 / DSM 23189 / NBRC 102662 / NCIMB 1420 / SS-2) TaxID=1122177 RepID=A0A2D0N919_FLAN2|nr:hypothetical protein [Flavilitoribacter nigricans]PHN04870.1 hypothetical protein CRP01_20400 [Flavilitoribacter nigricans DSM 23189 = NBRC 102662]
MKNRTPLFVLIALALLLAYCGQQIESTDVQTEGPYFPRRIAQPGETAQMEALLIGKLLLINNCFRIQSEGSNELITPIWPPDFDYQLTTDSTFVILNAAGNEVARTNAGIRLSGGEIRDAQALEGQIEGGVPKLLLSCPVPYWVVGEEISVVEPKISLTPEARNQLESWFNFYAPHIEDWRLSAFSLSNRWKIDSLLEVPFADIFPLKDRPDNWMIYAPGGRFNLDIYARDVIMQKNDDGTQTIYGMSPDSEAAIEDLDRGIRQRLLFCGTPCRFEDGYWEDAQTVVIAGLHQGDEQFFHPTIWRIKLDELTVQQFTYPTPLPDPFPFNYTQEFIYESAG